MLARLFGFAHTQSDDVKAKKTAAIFVQRVGELLKQDDVEVVIADRYRSFQTWSRLRFLLITHTGNASNPFGLLFLSYPLPSFCLNQKQPPSGSSNDPRPNRYQISDDSSTYPNYRPSLAYHLTVNCSDHSRAPSHLFLPYHLSRREASVSSGRSF